jgi:ABC-type amino acid transport system permease subunit
MTDLWHLVQTLVIGYPVPPEMIDPGYPQMIQRTGGIVLTLLVTVASMLTGSALAALLVWCRRTSLTDPRREMTERLFGRSLRASSIAVVEGVRGLPVILLVLIVFSLPYPVAGLRAPAVVLAVVAFGLYAGVYIAESMRSGLRAIDPGLRAAARVVGLSTGQIFRYVEWPLIRRTMWPDLVNVTVTVFKDTSTLAVTAVPELTYTARQMLMSEPANYGLVLLIVLFLYWAPAAAVSSWATRAEQRRVRTQGAVLSGINEHVGKGRSS